MSFVRLQVGSLMPESAPEGGEIPSTLERRALLVYSGTFNSMDGQVEVKDEHIERLAKNHNTFLKRLMTNLAGELPIKYCPPIQLDHSLSAHDTVGRLIGLVEIGEHSEDGQTLKALYGKVKILGRENVEKVLDGRWTHLSIGADLEEGKFQEVTITPFPAAGNASMLRARAKLSQAEYRSIFEKTVNSIPGVRPTKVDVSSTGAMAYYGDKERADQAATVIENAEWFKSVKVKQEADNLWVVECKFKEVDGVKLNEGEVMLERLKAYVASKLKLSAEDAEKKLAEMPEDEKAKLMTEAEAEQAKRDRMKGYLTAVKGMDDESAEKHLTEVSQEDLKKLEAEVEEHEKLVAEKEEKEKMSSDEMMESKAKMRALADKITHLSESTETRLAAIRLKAKESKIIARLSSLQASMKITPAEIKKVEITKLAKQNDATIDAVLLSYESREPVIMTGLVGSKNAVSAAEVEKSRLKAQMEKDILTAMPFTARMKKGSKLQEGEKEGAADTVSVHIDTDPHTDLMDEYTEVCGMMDSGKLDEAKERLKKRYMAGFPSHAADMSSSAESQHERMMALEEEIVKLQNEYKEVLKLAQASADSV